jgi:putative restriction endonuclease
LEKGVPFVDATGGVIRVIGPQGIFKPKDFQFPLSITTSPDLPYSDAFSTDDGNLLYKYRGTDPNHPDNVGLRQAGERNIPLVYFHGLIKGKYLATWPVFIRADDPRSLQFSVSVDNKLPVSDEIADDPETAIRRRYATTLVRSRIHQQAFRERVVAAYRSQCAMCRLRQAIGRARPKKRSDPPKSPWVSACHPELRRFSGSCSAANSRGPDRNFRCE